MKRLEDLINNYIYGANDEHSDDEAQRRHDVVKKWALVACAINAITFSVTVTELIELVQFQLF